jgi:hypothetical protein
MAELDEEKKEIERTIERARDGVSERIDELDVRLRTQYDLKQFAAEHATQLVAGGAVLGLLVGFGVPKTLRRIIQVGVPLGLIAWKVKQTYEADQTDLLP